jgi:putative transposase
MNDPVQAASVTRTLRLKVRVESYGWLNKAAVEVNQVFNWANATSIDAADRNRRANAKFLSGFDLCNLSAGASEFFEHIGSATIQRVCTEYAVKRRAARKVRLRWRVSRGARRSLGWVPFKAASLKRKGVSVRFCGKSFRVFERERLEGVKWRDGCFAQDAVGDWWLCLPVLVPIERSVAPREAVGIDLGLKDIAVTSDGERLEAGRWTQGFAQKLANAQRRGHRQRARRIHRKAARCRKDALHKFSRSIVDGYQNIVVGDVSSRKLVKTRMAKSVLDSGWGMLKAQLQYKGEYAGRCVKVVNESHTSAACSSCGSLTGPRGVNGLVVRSWVCSECGDSHDRDVNAARWILLRGEVSPSVSGNESSPLRVPPSQTPGRCEAATERVRRHEHRWTRIRA